MVDPLNTISRSSRCFTIGITNAVVYAVLWDGAYKRSLAANRKLHACSDGSGVFSYCLSGPLLYDQSHITVK